MSKEAMSEFEEMLSTLRMRAEGKRRAASELLAQAVAIHGVTVQLGAIIEGVKRGVTAEPVVYDAGPWDFTRCGWQRVCGAECQVIESFNADGDNTFRWYAGSQRGECFGVEDAKAEADEVLMGYGLTLDPGDGHTLDQGGEA